MERYEMIERIGRRAKARNVFGKEKGCLVPFTAVLILYDGFSMHVYPSLIYDASFQTHL